LLIIGGSLTKLSMIRRRERMLRWGIALGVFLASCQAAAAPLYPSFARTSLYVPVRDGVRLAVNVYRPATPEGVEAKPLPVIFVFTPYRARYREEGKVVEAALNDRLALRSLISAGYVVAVADVRGKGASFGTRVGFQGRTEARDGHDLVEWLAHQSFSSGEVGMIGCSYLGGTTFHTASTAPPSLKAVFIGATDLDKYAFVRRGGITAQFNTRPDEPPEVDLASVPVDSDPEGTQLRAAVAEHAANTPMAPLWYGMPYRDSVSALTGNAFWGEASVYNYLEGVRRAGVATYFWGNWQDEPTGQVILSAANVDGKFLAGPGSHCVPPPGFDFTGEVVRYFDHYLKHADNGIEREPRATYWVDGLGGKGGWVRANALPGASSRSQAFFLADGRSGVARSVNDGVLGERPAKPAEDRFTVDYDLPDPEYFAFWAKPIDEKGLTYTSAPLAAAMKLVGFPVVHLKVAADKPDADVFAYLEQVAPDGATQVISFGRLALSHRKLGKPPYDTLKLPYHSGLAAEVAPLGAGQTADLDFDLTPVSQVVPAGARLRMTITGADPRQRNLKQIMQTPAPRITVFRGGPSGSRIDLPVEP
jgi:putative CocE/NonD family hydrolase